MNSLQNTIQNVLEQAVSSGRETGVQFAAYRHGKLVIDAFAGIADPQKGTRVDGETLFPVFSTTKGIAATAVHLLAERGRLDYETPLVDFWPEFGKHGKTGITVRHVLNHTAGLPHIPPDVDVRRLNDWDAMCAAIAAMVPASKPGEQVEYHAITFGWLVGETVRRIDGRDFSRFLREEICAPLGIESLFCGLPAALDERVAILEEPDAIAPQQSPAQPGPQAIPDWLGSIGAWMNRPAVRRACLPASNGIMNARAIARHYASLLPGGVGGVELLPPARIELARTRDCDTSNFGLGYQVGSFADFESSLQSAFGHNGYGGSFGFADPPSGWSFGWTRNRFSEINTGQQALAEVHEILVD